jgi:hypothetical protein
MKNTDDKKTTIELGGIFIVSWVLGCPISLILKLVGVLDTWNTFLFFVFFPIIFPFAIITLAIMFSFIRKIPK